jgi:hypothetical protein
MGYIFRQYLRLIVIVVAVSGLTTGCGSQGLSLSSGDSENGANLTSAERELRQRAANFNRTAWEGVATGVAVGALLGGIGGYLSGKDAKSAAIGAGAGAVVGGVAGKIAGDYVASKQKTYARKEDQLNSMIVDVQGKNGEAAAMISVMNQVVADSRMRLAALQARQQTLSTAEHQAELQTVRRNRELMQEAADNAQKQLAVFQNAEVIYSGTHPDLDTSRYENEIETFERRARTMREITLSLTDPLLG